MPGASGSGIGSIFRSIKNPAGSGFNDTGSEPDAYKPKIFSTKKFTEKAPSAVARGAFVVYRKPRDSRVVQRSLSDEKA